MSDSNRNGRQNQVDISPLTDVDFGRLRGGGGRNGRGEGGQVVPRGQTENVTGRHAVEVLDILH
jgi:hypothetical protein